MILQALNDHYYRLLDEPESGVAPIGYSRADVSFVLVLSEQGELLDMYQVDFSELVPEHKKRQGVNPPPYFLCDKILYSLGISKDKKEGLKRFNAYKEYNIGLLSKVNSLEANAVSQFLKLWNPEEWENNEIISKNKDSYSKPENLNIVYKTEGADRYVHECKEINAIWINALNNDNSEEKVIAQCLVTGKQDIIARTHDVAIKGTGGQPAGTALVSFQIESFRSYNKTQSYNSPVSKKAAFAYGTALNYLISSEYNRVRLGDTTMVFWADKKSGAKEEQVLSWFLEPDEVTVENGEESDERRCIDYVTALQAKTILERIKAGLPIGDDNFDPNSRCFLLGLAPNAARLSVRFWQISSFGNVLSKIAQHYSDMNIVGLKNNQPPWRILKSIAVQEESRNIPPLLGGQLMKAIISGRMYPRTLYNAALIRCRSGGEHNGVTPVRAAIIKAFLCREYRTNNNKVKEEQITMSLNEDNTNIAYLLGRLFSVLEKLQKDALGNINASIRDRYFGAASATPGSVFPLLLRLSRHYIAKSEYGGLSDRKIQEIVNMIEYFPTHFSLEEQGQFILGYYHQNQANYQKNESNKTNKEDMSNE